MTLPAATSPIVDLSTWPGIVLGFGRDGRIAASNGRAEVLLDRAVIGAELRELLDPESSQRKWERISELRESDNGKAWELIFRTPETLIGPMTFSVLAGESSAPTAWLVEHPTDPRVTMMTGEMESVNAELVTAQRALVIEQRRLAAALRELERSNSALDEFAHVASHDLKAPLRAIIDYAELLEADVGPQLGTEQLGYLRRVNVLALRMRRMIGDVLEYARAGRETNVYEAVDTGALLREVVEYLAAPAGVRVMVDDGMPITALPRVPFEQVFRNLVGNAIKYRREHDATVRLSARDDGDCWHFIVADNGPGIPPAQRERIWQLFHTTRPGEGTGIGLAVVKRIVESEGGRVYVQSTAGEGAQFNVLWPKQPRPSATGTR
jgi:signal transduction histidine kinase